MGKSRTNDSDVVLNVFGGRADISGTNLDIDGNVVELNVLRCWADSLGTILPLMTIMWA